jgi:DNA polymerase III delta prime subunit
MNQILEKALNSKNLPNLLIYPEHGENVFFNLFNDIYKITTATPIKSEEISYTITNYYYEFDLKFIINRNINTLIEIIKEIIISKDFYSENNLKIILLKDFNHIKTSLQNKLRVIMEKYRETTVFICFTNTYDSIIQPLRSRFLSLRFSRETYKDKRKIIYNSDKKLKTHKYYDFMYSLKNEEIIKIIDKENEIESYKNIYDLVISEIITIYKKEKIDKKDYTKLKGIAYNILKNNINIKKFYYHLLNSLLKEVSIRDKSKYKLIKIFSDSEYNFIKSYRNIIILESLLINIYYTIKDDHPVYLL